MTDDLISRQAVIDEIRFGQSYITKISSTGEIENLFVNENRALEDAVDRVKELPSVTPTQNCVENALGALDCISREAVLDTLDRMDKVLDEDRTIENYKELLKECYTVLPPVNPQEPSETIHGSTYGGVSWGGTYKPQEPKKFRQCPLYSVSEDGRGQCKLLDESPEDTPLAKEQSCDDDAISREAVKDILSNAHLGESKIAEELNNLPSVNPQEPKTDVLDKIRAEISDRLGLLDCKKDILKIIDKYKAESEVQK